MSDTTDAAAHATAALSIIDDIAEWHLGANVLLVTARRHILALDAARVAAEQRAERLRKALKYADSRLIQMHAEDYMRRRGGDRPSLDWFRSQIDAQESNHYAVDGLEVGDLDAAPGDTEGEAQP